MKVILRSDIKKCIKNDAFWQFFPEYSTIKKDINNKLYTITCCKIDPKLLDIFTNLILRDFEKWKLYYKTDKIQVFYGTPRKVAIL